MRLASIPTLFALLVQLMAPAIAHSQETFTPAEKSAVQKASWQLFMAHAVTYQPKFVGWSRFADAFGIKSYLDGGKKLFRAAKKVKSWPAVSIEGNALKLTADGSTLTLELTNAETGEYLLNGKPFAPDYKKPILPQLEAAYKGALETRRGSFSFGLIPEAQAMDDDTKGLLGALGSLVVGSVVTVAVATAVAAAAPVVAGAVVVVGFAAAVGSIVCSAGAGVREVQGSSFGNRYANCMSAPLSWFGVNPRDRLYLAELDCGSGPYRGGSIWVTVKSTTGISQRRYFTAYDGKPSKIEITGGKHNASLVVSSDGSRLESGLTDNNSDAYGKLSRPKNTKLLDESQGLLRDFHAYTSLCADPNTRQEVMRLIARGQPRAEERAFDAKDPDQMNRSAE